MYKLRRLYMDSIGVDDNRFTDVMVGFTDTEDNPTDSIILLRNGAGKTTMMSLLLALIRPERREFLSYKIQKRTLTDLVQGGDTSHVVAEWATPTGQLLLTGAIYEWDGRQRPADYNTNGYKRFSQTWWCLTPEEGVEGATLDSLPFTYRSRGTYDREKFISHLNSLQAQHSADVVIAQAIKQWHAALRERNFDPDLFSYFVEVNSAEGGMKNLFKDIDSAGAFVNYLLRFVADPDQVNPVHQLLERNAAELVKRPMYEAEKAFCDEARIKVAALGAAYSDRQAAQQTLDHERGRAARYKTGLLYAAEIADESARIADSLVSAIEDELKPTRSELDMRVVRASFYRMKSAEFAELDAEAGLKQARERADEAQTTRDAWAALEHWLDLQTRQQTYRILEDSLAREREGAKPLQDRVEVARAELAGALQRAERQAHQEAEEIAAKITDLQGKEGLY